MNFEEFNRAVTQALKERGDLILGEARTDNRKASVSDLFKEGNYSDNNRNSFPIIQSTVQPVCPVDGIYDYETFGTFQRELYDGLRKKAEGLTLGGKPIRSRILEGWITSPGSYTSSNMEFIAPIGTMKLSQGIDQLSLTPESGLDPLKLGDIIEGELLSAKEIPVYGEISVQAYPDQAAMAWGRSLGKHCHYPTLTEVRLGTDNHPATKYKLLDSKPHHWD